jgi:hypothetical protein
MLQIALGRSADMSFNTSGWIPCILLPHQNEITIQNQITLVIIFFSQQNPPHQILIHSEGYLPKKQKN